jgi:hypothetical protein
MRSSAITLFVLMTEMDGSACIHGLPLGDLEKIEIL